MQEPNIFSVFRKKVTFSVEEFKPSISFVDYTTGQIFTIEILV